MIVLDERCCWSVIDRAETFESGLSAIETRLNC